MQAGETSSDLADALDALRAEIRLHGKTVLGWYVRRGQLVWTVINIKLRRSTNAATCKANRKAGLDAAQLRAVDAHDPAVEPAPNADLWNGLAALVELCPRTVDLATVSAAQAFIPALARIDPPARWDAPETFTVKPHVATALPLLLTGA